MSKDLITVKKLLAAVIIMAMLITATVDMLAYANSLNTEIDQMEQSLVNDLSQNVTAEITAEEAAPAGRPFNLNIRLDLPRITTYRYQEGYPNSQMFEEYKNVKVTIPLPNGITAVDPNNMDAAKKNLVINFPKNGADDFQGQTNKGKDIKLKVLNNGNVKNGTKFTFKGAKWSFDVDMYTDKEKKSSKKVNVTGAISETSHTATAEDAWGILKNHVKTEEIGNYVVFSFEVAAGLQDISRDGKKSLYSTATEQYDRYGRLKFQDYKITDTLPQLVQINRDGSKIKKNIWPDEVTVVKNAVSAYGIKEQIVYDSKNSTYKYTKGTTKQITFNQYNTYDPNPKTDIIGVSPQYTKYTVRLSYNKDAFLIDANEKVIQTFRITNEAKLDYQLLGEKATSDNDSDSASYVIRKGIGQIILNKYIVYPQDGREVRRAYDEKAKKEFPMSSPLKFTLYTDSACTKIARTVEGKNAVADYDTTRGNAVFDYMNAGTYYVKETGAIKHFGAKQNPMQVTVPRSGGTATIEFTNVNKDFGTIAVQKVRMTKTGSEVPFGGIEFELYKNEADVNNASKSADYVIITGSDGNGYLNNIPTDTYYAKEVMPYGYEPNEEIYEVKVEADFTKFKGFKASDGKYYGTDANPIVNAPNTGMLYLGVIKWDVDLMSETEINIKSGSNQVKAVSSSYEGYKLDLYYEKDGKIVRYQENGKNVTLTADENGIIKKRLPAGKYYVVANTDGYDESKYTPWAQNHKIADGRYYMGEYTVEVYDDNYDLPDPEDYKDGIIQWDEEKGAQDRRTNYDVIHNFSGMCNMSLEKLGSGQYVVPEARFDVYKIDSKGAKLPTKVYKDYKNVATNNKAYKFFANVEPGWYAFVETATGPQYYLPEGGIRKDLYVSGPVFDQNLTGKSGIEANKAKMIQATPLVLFENTLYGKTPLVGVTFKKVDATDINKQLYEGAEFSVYYIKNDVDGSKNLSPTDESAERVYLGVYYYKTNKSAKDTSYRKQTYNGVEFNIFNKYSYEPKERNYLVQGRNGKFVPAFGDDTTTMVGWIPYNLLGEDIKLYVEEITPPLGYDLPKDSSDRIVSRKVKGGTIDETNVLVLKNNPKPVTCNITVAVSNRSYSQTKDMTSADSRGTYVEGSTVRLYEWNESTKKWVYVAEKNTSIDGTYITESGAVFRTEFGKTYAIAEKKTGNKDNLYYYDVQHKWLLSNSRDVLTASADGKTAGTYALKEQTTIDGWTLYGPITMPEASDKMVNYKFTFYNLPLQNVWLGKRDADFDEPILRSGKFSIYRIPEGKSAYDDLSELEWVYDYGSNGGWATYKGAKLSIGNYVIVEVKAPRGYSNMGARKPFSVKETIKLIPGTNQYGVLVTMYNHEIEFLKDLVYNYMSKSVVTPTGGKIEGSLLGDKGESVFVSYKINGLRLSNIKNGVIYRNAVLEDSGLTYYAGQNGNGDEIKLTKDDYTLTSLVIQTNFRGNSFNATVEYLPQGSSTWKSVGVVDLSKQQATVTLGNDKEKVAAFRVKYDNNNILQGFEGGEITVNAKLYKRDILKTDEEIISVKNTCNYTFQYGIYDEEGNLNYYDSKEIKDAIINLNPTDLYPQAHIQKSAKLLPAPGNSGDIAKAGDQIRYTITLTNVSTAEQNPLRNPVILDLLPDEVKTVSQGQYEKYFDITMPSGIKLAAGSGMKTIDGDTAAVLFFDGALKKNESITVSFLTKVKDDAVSIDELIRNEAAASSAIKGYAVSGNDDAASFKDSNGNWPELNKTYQAIIKNLKKNAYGYITAKADNTIERNKGLTIHKFVQGELDKNNGYQNFLSNTTPGGMVNFKVILQNTGSTPVSNIRLADLLPQPNDKGDSTSSNNPDKDRESEWTPVPQSYDFFKVSTNGKKTKLNPDIYTAEGSFDQSLRGDASAFGGNWKQGGTFREGVTAIGFNFGAETLKEGEYISLELKMTAPASGEYAGKFASNNASVYYNFADKTNLLLNSNTVHTIYHTKLVGMGGKVFLDEDMDGLYTGNEKMVSGIPVRLHVYENGKLKDTLLTETDAGGRYYFDNLFPSYVKDGKFEGYYYQYQAEFVIPKGTCLTDAYAGGADAWKDNKLDEPGKTEAPKTIGDAAYADKDREKDSNADVKTYRTELFYLNPAQEGGAIRTREGGYDLTYDAGLVRVRNIEIKKYEGSTLKPLQGAQFCLTGTGLPEAGITVTSDAQGIVSFKNPIPGADGKVYRKVYRINYYGNYKIREVKAPEGYVNQNWQTAINAGEDKTNLTYEALNEPEQLTYAVSNPKLTSLTIEKKVINGTNDDLKKDFYFTAIIEGRMYEGAYKLTAADGTIINKATDEKGRIVLKHGQKAVIEGLEDGQLYIVREEKADGFTSHITKGMGTIAADAKQNVVTCTNTKDSGYVRIKKVYDGNSIHRSDVFDFNVKIDGKGYSGYYTVNAESRKATNGLIQIKGGETAVIEAGIGQTFTITEAAYSNYKTSVTASSGIKISNRTTSGTISSAIGEVTYTNTLQTQGLIVSKEINNTGAFPELLDDTNFRFKLEVDGKAYMGEYTYYPDLKASPKKSEKRNTTDGIFVLSPKAAAHFEGLVKGSSYKITEIETPSKFVTVPAITGKVGDGNGEAKITNQLKKTVNLKISKTVTNKSGDTTEFKFNLYLDGKKQAKFSYKLYNANGTYSTKTITDGNIKIKHGQYALIEGIPSGTKYEVREVDVPNTYTCVVPTNFKGTLEKDTDVKYINGYSIKDGYVTLRKVVVSDDAADYNRQYTVTCKVGYSRRYEDIKKMDLRDGKVSTASYSKDNTYGLKFNINLWEVILLPVRNWDFETSGPSNNRSDENCWHHYMGSDYGPKPYKHQTFTVIDEINTPSGMTKTFSRIDGNGKFEEIDKNAPEDFSVKYYEPDSTQWTIAGCRYIKNQMNNNIFTVTNTRGYTYGSLNITKKLSGVKADDQTFALMIERYDSTNKIWEPYVGDVTSSLSSRGTFAVSGGLVDIRADEKLTIKNILLNTQFRITEKDNTGIYTKSGAGFDSFDKTKATGTIKINGAKNVTITNTVPTGTLVALNIYKTNVGGNANDEFRFKVYLNEKPYSGSYNIIQPANSKDAVWTAKTTTDGVIILKHDQRAKIEGIVPNTTYYVEEVENPNYVSECTTNNASGTLDKNTSVKFRNTIKNTGLSISKTTVGAEEKDAADVFKFLVTIKMPGETDYTPYVGTYSIQQDGKTGGDIQISDGIVQIKANQLAVMKDIPVGSEYKIEEIAHDKYTLKSKAGDEGKITELGNLATFVNTRKTAGLTIKKVQNGGEPSDIFHFKVTLNEAEYTGSYTVKDAAGNTTTATASGGWLQLKGRQQAEITGIPIGAKYEITEKDRTDYDEQRLYAAGFIEEGENKNNETFINDKIEKALIFSKSNIGGNREDSFEFELKVNGNAYRGEYTLTDTDADGDAQTLSTSNGVISLKGGQQASVKLPVGSKYTLTERNRPGYTKRIPATSTYAEGGEEPEITVGEGSAEGTMFDGLQRIDFSNLYTDKGLLEIKKIREGGSPTDLFTFNVTIEGKPYEGAYQVFTEEGILLPGTYTAENGVFTMTGGGKILISGLNPGAKYTVTETMHPDYECNQSTQSGTIAKNGTPEEGSYSVNHADFVNVHKTGGFSVYKNNQGGNASDVFTFTALQEVTETDEDGRPFTVYEPFSGMSYRLYREIIGGWEPVLSDEGIDFATDAEGRFSLTGGQKAVFEDVDTGAKIRITEADAEGYTVSVRLDENSEKETGTIDFTVTGDTSHEVVYINRIIEQDIVMPETGGTGTMMFAGFSLLSAAAAVVCLYRRRREKAEK
jgi:uncharacterized repeat protein (TIGR01451 family)